MLLLRRTPTVPVLRLGSERIEPCLLDSPMINKRYTLFFLDGVCSPPLLFVGVWSPSPLSRVLLIKGLVLESVQKRTYVLSRVTPVVA